MMMLRHAFIPVCQHSFTLFITLFDLLKSYAPGVPESKGINFFFAVLIKCIIDCFEIFMMMSFFLLQEEQQLTRTTRSTIQLKS